MQINAFGKIIQLELQNSDSILPGASIEYHTDNGVETKLLSDNGCFKIGKVSNSNASSSAAISDCDGLVSLSVSYFFMTVFLLVVPYRAS